MFPPACRYHSLYRPAPSAEVKARLVFDPRDSERHVRGRLRQYWEQVPTLKSFYPEAIHVNADQDPHTIFESIESRLVGRLPKTLTDGQQGQST